MPEVDYGHKPVLLDECIEALAILSLASLIFLELGLMLARPMHSTGNSVSAAGSSVRVDPARLGRRPR